MVNLYHINPPGPSPRKYYPLRRYFWLKNKEMEWRQFIWEVVISVPEKHSPVNEWLRGKGA